MNPEMIAVYACLLMMAIGCVGAVLFDQKFGWMKAGFIGMIVSGFFILLSVALYAWFVYG